MTSFDKVSLGSTSPGKMSPGKTSLDATPVDWPGGLRRVARAAGLACLPVLVWLSWIPKDWEVRSGAAGQFEHVIAYAGTAFLLGLGFFRAPARHLGLALVVLAGLLEIGQIWVPGRTAQAIDFAASVGGVLSGLAVARARAGRRDAAGHGI